MGNDEGYVSRQDILDTPRPAPRLLKATSKRHLTHPLENVGEHLRSVGHSMYTHLVPTGFRRRARRGTTPTSVYALGLSPVAKPIAGPDDTPHSKHPALRPRDTGPRRVVDDLTIDSIDRQGLRGRAAAPGKHRTKLELPPCPGSTSIRATISRGELRDPSSTPPSPRALAFGP